MDNYIHLLNKELFIDSTAYFHNEILDIGCSTFSDIMKNSDTPYHFSSNDKQMSLGCIMNRKRDSIVFEQSDISTMFDRKLMHWFCNEKNKDKELSKSIGEMNKFYLNLSVSDKMIMVQPVKITENSLLKPFYISFETGGYAVTQEKMIKMNIYSFAENDIKRLKKQLEDVIGKKYSIYPKNQNVASENESKELTYNVLSEERVRELFNKTLDWLAELEKGQELYTTLHDVLGMTNNEIENESFELQNYYDTPAFSCLVNRDENGIPEYCYSTLSETGDVILIRRGESGYHNVDKDFIARIDGNSSKEIVQKLNEPLGITTAEEQAMSMGSMFGWDTPGANPKIYEEIAEHNNEDDESDDEEM